MSLLVRSSVSTVDDLHNRKFEITLLGRVVEKLRKRRGAVVDERSHLGQYLMHYCLPFADDWGVGKKSGRENVGYQMPTDQVIKLLEEEKIRPSAKVMNAALEEDEENC